MRFINSLFVKVAISTLLGAFFLFSLLWQHYDITKLRQKIPDIAREVRLLEEENTRLLYEIERFENPKHLLELAKRPEFSHLSYPYKEEIAVVNVHREPPISKEVLNNSRPSTFFAMINGILYK